MENKIKFTGQYLAQKAEELAVGSKYPANYFDMAQCLRDGDIVEASIRIGMVMYEENGFRLDKLNYIRKSLSDTLNR